MHNDKDISINEFIKLLGKKSESKIRSNIHALLKDDKTVDLVKKALHPHVNMLKGMKKNTETISQQLNLPTKTDIANIAKLGIQIEEKIDALEEKVLRLAQEKTPHHTLTTKQGLTRHRESKEIDLPSKKEIELLKRLMKMNIIMGNISDNDWINEKVENMIRVKRRD
ncbi:hypothetical protein ACLM5H_00435 [Fredinandcohnia humi]